MKTESQIDSSKRSRSGTTSKASDTGSTVGRRIAKQRSATNAMRRFWRSLSLVRTRLAQRFTLEDIPYKTGGPARNVRG